jgi:hypothetical protein
MGLFSYAKGMETCEGEKIIKLIKKLIKKILRPNGRLYSYDFPLNSLSYINSKKKFIFNNVRLFGNSRFALLDNQVFFISSNFNQSKFIEEYLTDEESNKIIEVKNKTLSLIFLKPHSKELDGNTVSLLHPNPNNIYHFLFEACFDLLEAHRLNIPIDNLIIDRQLNSKFYSFLKEIIQVIYPKKEINIFKVSKYEKILAKNFISFPNKNSQIHWLRKQKTKPMHYWNKIWLINAQKIFSTLYEKSSKRNITLFLIRNSTVRNTLNERSIIDLLKKSYFIKTFDPAKKSFKSVSYYINSSSMIVGQTSAALANILFARKNKKFITWKYNGPEQNKSLMKELFSILGHTLIELDAVPCIPRETGLEWQALHITQSNLHISPDIVLSTLNEKK